MLNPRAREILVSRDLAGRGAASHGSTLKAPNLSLNMWQQWVNALLGLWVIAVPFLALDADTLMWTLSITGIAIAVVSAWGAAETTPEQREQRLQRQS